MPQPKTIRLIRFFLLLTVVVGTVVTLRQLGGKATPPGPAPGSGNPADHDGEREFELSHSDEGRLIYRVRGDRPSRSAEGDEVEVLNFHLTLYRENGQEIQIAGERALINRGRNEGNLTGSVEVRGENGLVLESEQLRVLAGGDVLDSPVPVVFRYGSTMPIHGRANRLRSNLGGHELAMAGNVVLEGLLASGGALRLTAGRLFFQEAERRLQLDQNVSVEFGEGSLTANRMTLHLSPQSDGIEYIRAHWKVTTDWRYLDEEGGAHRLLSDSAMLSMLLDPATSQPRKLELEGTGRRPAWLSTESEAGEALRLTARYLQADLEGGRAVGALALGRAELWQTFTATPDSPWRLACAGRIAARFGAGSELRELELEEGVELHEPGLQVNANRAISSIFRDTLEAVGTPAVMLSSRGELSAPTLLLQRGSGSLHAQGGVSAVFSDSASFQGSPISRGEGPFRVESGEAIWTQDEGSFLFRHQVQAWRGDNVLQAEQLRGDDLRHELSAAGSVKTQWRQPGNRDPSTVQQVTVTAKLLSYRQQEDRLVYQEEVVVETEQYRLRCDELSVSLDESGGARSMVCKDRVQLEELEDGRTATADRAEYDLATRFVVLSGEPVALLEKDGGKMEGRRLQVDLATGRARMLSQPPAAGSGGGR